MDDRRRNRDLHHITRLRHLGECALRAFILVGALASWALIAHACLGA